EKPGYRQGQEVTAQGSRVSTPHRATLHVLQAGVLATRAQGVYSVSMSDSDTNRHTHTHTHTHTHILFCDRSPVGSPQVKGTNFGTSIRRNQSFEQLRSREHATRRQR